MELCTTEINRLVTHKKFLGAYPCNRIPETTPTPPYAIILNTDKDDQPGSHWVAVFVSENNHGEYFDSFAFPPLKEEITSFLAKQDICFCTSQVVIQHPASVACGHFAIGFILARLRGISFQKYLTYFKTENLRDNDKLIIKWNSSFQIANYTKLVRLLMHKDTAMAEKNHDLCHWSYR